MSSGIISSIVQADHSAQPREMCPACGKHSDSVYEEGWICTNPDCARFWLLETRIGLFPIPPGFSLQYDTKWLRPARTPGDIGIPYDIRPSPPAVDAIEVERYAGDRTLWKGECFHMEAEGYGGSCFRVQPGIC